jgi:hypothetical protein
MNLLHLATFTKKTSPVFRNTKTTTFENQKRTFSRTNFTFSGAHHHEEPDEDDIKYGITVPKPTKRDQFLAKFLGANFIFWIWYKIIHEDGYKRILALERPHFEHPADDELSDDDDEFWEKNDPKFFKTDKDDLETMLEYYHFRGADRKVGVTESTKRFFQKWE